MPEGEKDADSLVGLGYPATSLPYGGGKRIDPTILEPLRGSKVFLLGDNDEVGRKDLINRAVLLDPLVKKLKVYHPPPSPYKDITEFLEAGAKLSDLLPFDEWRKELRTRDNGRSTEIALEIMTAKEVMKLPTRSRDGELLGPLLYRGDRLVLGAHTGHGKTSWALQAIAAAVRGGSFLAWKGRGECRALVIDVEQGIRTIQRRIREVGIQESESVYYLRIPDGLALDSDRNAIAKMEKIFHNGRYDAVLADPLYKLSRGDPNDSRSAVDLMRRFDGWRERYGFALVLPMHCRKPHPNAKLTSHDLFGSSSYQWGAEVICGLDRKSSGFSLLHWWKDREGDLAEDGAVIGTHWGLSFDRENGFTRATEGGGRIKTSFRVRALLREHPEGMRKRDMARELDVAESTIKNALDELNCMVDDSRLKAVEQRWQLPTTLPGFEEPGVTGGAGSW
jgi:hypothetical protein